MSYAAFVLNSIGLRPFNFACNRS